MANVPESLHGLYWREWLLNFPEIGEAAEERPVLWINNRTMPAASALVSSGFTLQDIRDAALRLKRFAPFISKAFDSTAAHGGLIESPLRETPEILEAIKRSHPFPASRLFLKFDNTLPISGSIKDRGGVYEVLCLAENIAMYARKLKWSDDYSMLAGPEMRKFFSRFSLSMGSTGNLALAAGAVGKVLGFAVKVHMPRMSRAWKKEYLRHQGFEVIEHDADYEETRKLAMESCAQDKQGFYVGNENSRNMFLGYSLAGIQIKSGLASQGIKIDDSRPLYVYVPCGSGCAASGICFGLKQAFQDNVRFFFAEPVATPSMLLGLGSRLPAKFDARDIGLSGLSVADELTACKSAGQLALSMLELADGCVTVKDKELFSLLALVNKYERSKLEPSALAGLAAFITAAQGDFGRGRFESGVHIAWLSGGGLTPDAEWSSYYQEGETKEKFV